MNIVVVGAVEDGILTDGVLASDSNLSGQSAASDPALIEPVGVVNLGNQSVGGLVIVRTDIAVIVQIQVVLHVLVHAGENLGQAGVFVDVGLLLDVAVDVGSLTLLVVDSLEGALRGVSLVDLDGAVDFSVQHDVAHSGSVVVQIDEIVSSAVNAVVEVSGGTVSGSGVSDFVQSIGSVQDILGLAIAVVVDDLQPVAVANLFDGLHLARDKIGLHELVPAHDVALVLQGGGADVHFAVDITVYGLLAGIGLGTVSGGEDGLHDVLVGSGNSGVGLNAHFVSRELGAAVVNNRASRVQLNDMMLILNIVAQAIKIINPSGRQGAGVFHNVADEPLRGILIFISKVLEVLGILHVQAAAKLLNGGLGALVVLDVVTGILQQAAQNLGALDVSAAALADAGQVGGDVQGTGGSLAVDHERGLALGQDGVTLQVAALVAHDNAGHGFHVQVLLRQGRAVVGIAEAVGVPGHLLKHDGAEQQLGHDLTGSGLAEEGGAGEILQHASLGSDGGGVGLPVGADELIVLVVTDSAENHRQDFVTSYVVVGMEVAVVAALDVAGVGTVGDVTGVPGAVDYVGELVVGGVGLVAHAAGIAGGDTVNDGRDLAAADGISGIEVPVLISAEDAQVAEDVNGDAVCLADICVILEVRGAGGGHQRQAHDERQYQCENLLEISHSG